VPDLRRGELLAASVLCGGIILLGIFPAPILELMAASITRFSAAFIGNA